MKRFFYKIKPLVLVSLPILLGVFAQCAQQEQAQNTNTSTAAATTPTHVTPAVPTTTTAASVPPSVKPVY
jgi:hypothetical protein